MHCSIIWCYEADNLVFYRSTFTVGFQNNGGIEYLDRKTDKWLPAVVEEGAMYLNVADVMTRISNGKKIELHTYSGSSLPNFREINSQLPKFPCFLSIEHFPQFSCSLFSPLRTYPLYSHPLLIPTHTYFQTTTPAACTASPSPLQAPTVSCRADSHSYTLLPPPSGR